MDKKYEVIAECKCGRKVIDIKEIINTFGYIECINWQCPNCWSVVTITVYEKKDEKVQKE